MTFSSLNARHSAAFDHPSDVVSLLLGELPVASWPSGMQGLLHGPPTVLCHHQLGHHDLHHWALRSHLPHHVVCLQPEGWVLSQSKYFVFSGRKESLGMSSNNVCATFGHNCIHLVWSDRKYRKCLCYMYPRMKCKWKRREIGHMQKAWLKKTPGHNESWRKWNKCSQDFAFHRTI